MLTSSNGISATWFSEDVISGVSKELNKKTDANVWYKDLINLLGLLRKKSQNKALTDKKIDVAFEEVIRIKGDANKILAQSIISELLSQIKVENIVVNKVSVDYLVPYIYFWFEIKDNDFGSADKIELLIQKLNIKFKASEFILKCLINEESLELNAPRSFLVIK